jgi:hypothetical protein
MKNKKIKNAFPGEESKVAFVWEKRMKYQYDASTRVNNVVALQQASRRRKWRKFDCNMADRARIVRERLQEKLRSRAVLT